MNERDLEKTEELQGMLTDVGIRKIRNELPAPGTVGPEFCIRCDSEMPLARRKHGFHICVECKTFEEMKA